jgi:hypothetical protein
VQQRIFSYRFSKGRNKGNHLDAKSIKKSETQGVKSALGFISYPQIGHVSHDWIRKCDSTNYNAPSSEKL